MCGRFFINPKVIKSRYQDYELQEFIDIEYQEVFPGDKILAITYEDGVQLKSMKWGMRNHQGKLLINARSEGIADKAFYRKMLNSICLIPCSGFFEWKDKQKYRISKASESLIYLVGLYRNDEVVIMTAGSEADLKAIHHRSPIIILEKDMLAFLKREIGVKVDNEQLVIKQESEE